MPYQKEVLRRHSPAYNFVGIYESGVTIRWGRTIKENPSFAPFPELADISISNRCNKGCNFCYRDSVSDGKIMDLDTYKYILQQLCSKDFGPVFQVAIGGGEPSEHPNIVEILMETRKKQIIPNLTTNAESIDNELLRAFKKYCGAVAVSISNVNSEFMQNKVRPFLDMGIKTNIHYLLTERTLGQSIDILKGKWDHVFENINAIVFLTHKSLGRAMEENNLAYDETLKQFLALIDKKKCRMNIGFDACFVPLLLTHTSVDSRLLDSCECGFFSVYIDESLNVKPCSFATDDNYSHSLNRYDLEHIWTSKFERYRLEMKRLCGLECKHHDDCRGGCLFHPYLNFCNLRESN